MSACRVSALNSSSVFPSLSASPSASCAPTRSVGRACRRAPETSVPVPKARPSQAPAAPASASTAPASEPAAAARAVHGTGSAERPNSRRGAHVLPGTGTRPS
ncbi:MAG: hypothetical protein EOO73_24910 [Myxococcales bacterium]|nr:MAG: hypothetical protein EOO73_24910 [Myxococcales bacterium]